MTKHKEEQPTTHDNEKPISFNFLIFKGKMTFKQFLLTIGIAVLGSAIVFSSIKFNLAGISYQKDAMELDSKSIKTKSDIQPKRNK
jgi:hypothetical protein